MRSSRSTLTVPGDGARGMFIGHTRSHPRKQNEYVDTPQAKPLVHAPTKLHTKPVTKSSEHSRENVLLPGRPPTTFGNIINSQPSSIGPPLKKDKLDDSDDSIICSQCNKCKCGACTNPRELPSKWICGGKYKVSPETAVECITCVNCVQCVFYHSSMDDQDSEFECVSDPCACCNRPHCCKRWTYILAMSLCLPCLCLYPPAKLGLMCCKGLYNKWGTRGCTCKSSSSSNQSGKTSRSRTRVTRDSSSQCRGLLVESDRESSSVSNS